MSQWWTYRPEDFLLFSERVYWRLFELTNAAVWPWPVAALLLGAAIPVLVLLRRPRSGRPVAAILAIVWLVVAWAFFWNQYRTINWAAAYVVPFFAIEAALLVLIGSVRGAVSFPAARNGGVVLGWALFAYAIAVHPLTVLVAGRPLAGAELFAVAPDPTAVATLGLLAAAQAGPARWWLLPVPLLWCVVSWATLQTMESWEAWLPLASVALALLALALNRRPSAP